jgi:mannose-6-phosphate isomerase-like protein (cupin superfamily)
MEDTPVTKKLTWCFAVAMFVAGAWLAAQSQQAVTFVSHEQVGGCAKGGSLAKGPDLLVQCSNRTGPGVVEVHLKETDVMYFIDGSATLVTGGTTVNGKAEKDPNQIRGTDIKGGEARPVTKGDVVVVPAGVPHWFKEVPKSVSYYVVKVLKP